jgi:hypothetical protein
MDTERFVPAGDLAGDTGIAEGAAVFVGVDGGGGVDGRSGGKLAISITGGGGGGAAATDTSSVHLSNMRCS